MLRRPAAIAAVLLLAGTLAGCQTLTLLPDGRALVIAGARAELIDPVAGTRTVLPAPAVARLAHSATLLADGRVLLAGGADENAPLGSAELLAADASGFSPTGDLAEARSLHTATLLTDGSVLLVGGGQVSQDQEVPPLASAERYDPASGTFTATGSLAGGRILHTATLAADGGVVIIGGSGGRLFLAPIERYDPAAGTFSVIGELPKGRAAHTATLLPDGRILVAGGLEIVGKVKKGEDPDNIAIASTLLVDPVAGTVTEGPAMGTARAGHVAAALEDGRVLIAGGVNADSEEIRSAEIYDPATGTFSETGRLTAPRTTASASLLPDGRILVVGLIQGETEDEMAIAAEIYDPATGTFTALDG